MKSAIVWYAKIYLGSNHGKVQNTNPGGGRFCRQKSGTGTPFRELRYARSDLDKDKSNLAFVTRYGVQTQCVDLAEKGSCVTN